MVGSCGTAFGDGEKYKWHVDPLSLMAALSGELQRTSGLH